MKTQDIFTNIHNWEGKRCKNNSKCHESAPRGSKKGTQGLKNAKVRGIIPPALFIEIFSKIKELEGKIDILINKEGEFTLPLDNGEKNENN